MSDFGLERVRIFNPEGKDYDISEKRIIGGDTTNLIEFAEPKYDWAYPRWYRTSMNNFWIPEEIPMTQDIKDYRNLPTNLQTIVNKVLSFLIYLDSVQVVNLPNINEYITASEVKLCLTLQASDEAIHSQSYSHILNSICEPAERKKIAYEWKTDPILLERNKFIGDLYEEFASNPTVWGLIRTAMANFILEGVYFYSGFMTFYAFGRIGLMPSTVQQIRYINRDELTHLGLFRNIIKTIRNENPDLFTPERVEELRQMMATAVEAEINWGQYVMGNNLDGVTPELIEKYIKYIGNMRLNMIDLPGLWPDCTENPMPWIDKVASSNGVKVDFFEGKVTAYTKAAKLNWKDL